MSSTIANNGVIQPAIPLPTALNIYDIQGLTVDQLCTAAWPLLTQEEKTMPFKKFTAAAPPAPNVFDLTRSDKAVEGGGPSAIPEEIISAICAADDALASASRLGCSGAQCCAWSSAWLRNKLYSHVIHTMIDDEKKAVEHASSGQSDAKGCPSALPQAKKKPPRTNPNNTRRKGGFKTKKDINDDVDASGIKESSSHADPTCLLKTIGAKVTISASVASSAVDELLRTVPDECVLALFINFIKDNCAADDTHDHKAFVLLVSKMILKATQESTSGKREKEQEFMVVVFDCLKSLLQITSPITKDLSIGEKAVDPSLASVAFRVVVPLLHVLDAVTFADDSHTSTLARLLLDATNFSPRVPSNTSATAMATFIERNKIDTSKATTTDGSGNNNEEQVWDAIQVEAPYARKISVVVEQATDNVQLHVWGAKHSNKKGDDTQHPSSGRTESNDNDDVPNSPAKSSTTPEQEHTSCGPDWVLCVPSLAATETVTDTDKSDIVTPPQHPKKKTGPKGTATVSGGAAKKQPVPKKSLMFDGAKSLTIRGCRGLNGVISKPVFKGALSIECCLRLQVGLAHEMNFAYNKLLLKTATDLFKKEKQAQQQSKITRSLLHLHVAGLRSSLTDPSAVETTTDPAKKFALNFLQMSDLDISKRVQCRRSTAPAVRQLLAVLSYHLGFDSTTEERQLREDMYRFARFNSESLYTAMAGFNSSDSSNDDATKKKKNDDDAGAVASGFDDDAVKSYIDLALPYSIVANQLLSESLPPTSHGCFPTTSGGGGQAGTITSPTTTVPHVATVCDWCLKMLTQQPVAETMSTLTSRLTTVADTISAVKLVERALDVLHPSEANHAVLVLRGFMCTSSTTRHYLDVASGTGKKPEKELREAVHTVLGKVFSMLQRCRMASKAMAAHHMLRRHSSNSSNTGLIEGDNEEKEVPRTNAANATGRFIFSALALLTSPLDSVDIQFATNSGLEDVVSLLPVAADFSRTASFQVDDEQEAEMQSIWQKMAEADDIRNIGEPNSFTNPAVSPSDSASPFALFNTLNGESEQTLNLTDENPFRLATNPLKLCGPQRALMNFIEFKFSKLDRRYPVLIGITRNSSKTKVTTSGGGGGSASSPSPSPSNPGQALAAALASAVVPPPPPPPPALPVPPVAPAAVEGSAGEELFASGSFDGTESAPPTPVTPPPPPPPPAVAPPPPLPAALLAALSSRRQTSEPSPVPASANGGRGDVLSITTDGTLSVSNLKESLKIMQFQEGDVLGIATTVNKKFENVVAFFLNGKRIATVPLPPDAANCNDNVFYIEGGGGKHNIHVTFGPGNFKYPPFQDHPSAFSTPTPQLIALTATATFHSAIIRAAALVSSAPTAHNSCTQFLQRASSLLVDKIEALTAALNAPHEQEDWGPTERVKWCGVQKMYLQNMQWYLGSLASAEYGAQSHATSDVLFAVLQGVAKSEEVPLQLRCAALETLRRLMMSNDAIVPTEADVEDVLRVGSQDGALDSEDIKNNKRHHTFDPVCAGRALQVIGNTICGELYHKKGERMRAGHTMNSAAYGSTPLPTNNATSSFAVKLSRRDETDILGRLYFVGVATKKMLRAHPVEALNDYLSCGMLKQDSEVYVISDHIDSRSTHADIIKKELQKNKRSWFDARENIMMGNNDTITVEVTNLQAESGSIASAGRSPSKSPSKGSATSSSPAAHSAAGGRSVEFFRNGRSLGVLYHVATTEPLFPFVALFNADSAARFVPTMLPEDLSGCYSRKLLRSMFTSPTQREVLQNVITKHLKQSSEGNVPELRTAVLKLLGSEGNDFDVFFSSSKSSTGIVSVCNEREVVLEVNRGNKRTQRVPICALEVDPVGNVDNLLLDDDSFAALIDCATESARKTTTTCSSSTSSSSMLLSLLKVIRDALKTASASSSLGDTTRRKIMDLSKMLLEQFSLYNFVFETPEEIIAKAFAQERTKTNEVSEATATDGDTQTPSTIFASLRDVSNETICTGWEPLLHPVLVQTAGSAAQGNVLEGIWCKDELSLTFDAPTKEVSDCSKSNAKNVIQKVTGTGEDQRGRFILCGTIENSYRLNLMITYEKNNGNGNDNDDNDAGSGGDGDGGGAGWSCEVCTFINEDSVSRCAMCTAPKPGANWTCAACTYAFNNVAMHQCSICGTNRPNNDDEDDEDDSDGFDAICGVCGATEHFTDGFITFHKSIICPHCNTEANFVPTEEFVATATGTIGGSQLTLDVILCSEQFRIAVDHKLPESEAETKEGSESKPSEQESVREETLIPAPTDNTFKDDSEKKREDARNMFAHAIAALASILFSRAFSDLDAETTEPIVLAKYLSCVNTAHDDLQSALICMPAEIFAATARALIVMNTTPTPAIFRTLQSVAFFASENHVETAKLLQPGLLTKLCCLASNAPHPVIRASFAAIMTHVLQMFRLAPTAKAATKLLYEHFSGSDALRISAALHGCWRGFEDPNSKAIVIVLKSLHRIIDATPADEEESSCTNTTKAAPPAEPLPAVLDKSLKNAFPHFVQLPDTRYSDDGHLVVGQIRGSRGIAPADGGSFYYEVEAPENIDSMRCQVVMGWGTIQHEREGSMSHVGGDVHSFGFDLRNGLRLMGGERLYNTTVPVNPHDTVGCLLDFDGRRVCWSINGTLQDWQELPVGDTDPLFPYISASAQPNGKVVTRLENCRYVPEGFTDFSADIDLTDFDTLSATPPQSWDFYASLTRFVNEMEVVGVSAARMVEGDDWIDNATRLLSTSHAGMAEFVEKHCEKDVRKLAPYIQQLRNLSELSSVSLTRSECLKEFPAWAVLCKGKDLFLSSARWSSISKLLDRRIIHHRSPHQVNLDRERAKVGQLERVAPVSWKDSIMGQLFKQADRNREMFRMNPMFKIKYAGDISEDNGGLFRSAMSLLAEEIMSGAAAAPSTNEAMSTASSSVMMTMSHSNDQTSLSDDEGRGSNGTPSSPSCTNEPFFRKSDHSLYTTIVPNVNKTSSDDLRVYTWLGCLIGNAALTGAFVLAIDFPRIAWKMFVGDEPTIEEFYHDCSDSVRGSIELDEFIMNDEYFFEIPGCKEYKPPTSIVQGGGGGGSSGHMGLGMPSVTSMSAMVPNMSTCASLDNMVDHPRSPTTDSSTMAAEHFPPGLLKHRRQFAVNAVLHQYDTQLKAIASGIASVLPAPALAEMRWVDLQRRVCGVASVSFTDLWDVMDTNLLSDTTKEIFSSALELMSDEARSKLLLFCTGQSRLPIPEKIKVICGDEPTQFPTAHTCSPISMVIQPYETAEQMCEKLMVSSAHAHEYGFV